MARIHGIDHEILPLNLGGNPFGWTADQATSFEVLDAFVARPAVQRGLKVPSG